MGFLVHIKAGKSLINNSFDRSRDAEKSERRVTDFHNKSWIAVSKIIAPKENFYLDIFHPGVPLFRTITIIILSSIN